MLERIDAYRAGSVTLAGLVNDLRGLFVEADPHDHPTRDDFEAHWSPIDAEYELRTEAWAPPGAASDERLAEVVASFASWVQSIIDADQSTEHR